MTLIERLAVTAAAAVLAAPLMAAPATAATRTYVCAQGKFSDWYPLRVVTVDGTGCTGPDEFNGPGVIVVSSWGKTYNCESVLWAAGSASVMGFRCAQV
ncbi:hypothetical protein [Streptosporangium sp. NPDC051022]|uniref:hypothetical protein n=1 Tax=Streptosporangium sp. NPDC051022 TaxID=3155752 RepID=UPI0034293AD4